MAGVMDRFNKLVRGRSDKLVDFTSTINPRGELQRLSEFNVIINSWKNILSTPTRTYIDDPEYGSDLSKYIFSPADFATKRLIEYEIKSKLLLYDDRASIQNIDIEFFKNRKGFKVKILVEYDRQEAEIIQEFDETLLK